MSKLSHTDRHGRASMVDVGHKPVQDRRAVAAGCIALAAETRKLIRENTIKKGDVLRIAEIAGIMAAKNTAGTIPLCHPLLLSDIKVRVRLTRTGAMAEASVNCSGQTGVEMEALHAVSVALLTVYDMCKAVDKRMIISDIRLLSKEKH